MGPNDNFHSSTLSVTQKANIHSERKHNILGQFSLSVDNMLSKRDSLFQEYINIYMGAHKYLFLLYLYAGQDLSELLKL